MNDTATAQPQTAQEKFQVHLSNWLANAQALVVAHHQAQGFTKFNPSKLSVDPGGKKFIRVVKTDGSSRSAYAFIDVATGDVLKPDGWKRPAKGARGNIYTEHLGVSAYGALYAR